MPRGISSIVFCLFPDGVLQEEDTDEQGNKDPGQGESLDSLRSSCQEGIETEECQKEEKQTLKEIFCFSAHYYIPP